VILDSYHDHQTASASRSTPPACGATRRAPGTGEDDSWDPVWDVATAGRRRGVDGGDPHPLQPAALQPRGGADVGDPAGAHHQPQRRVLRLLLHPAHGSGAASRASGTWRGCAGSRRGSGWRCSPTPWRAPSTWTAAGTPTADRSEYRSTAGLDLKYRVTSNLTLDATVNPDFGQVEVDPAVINLGVIRDLLPGEAALLRGGERDLRLPLRRRRAALLHPPHRPAAAGGAVHRAARPAGRRRHPRAPRSSRGRRPAAGRSG
jgi:hypothetical protein